MSSREKDISKATSKVKETNMAKIITVYFFIALLCFAGASVLSILVIWLISVLCDNLLVFLIDVASSFYTVTVVSGIAGAVLALIFCSAYDILTKNKYITEKKITKKKAKLYFLPFWAVPIVFIILDIVFTGNLYALHTSAIESKTDTSIIDIYSILLYAGTGFWFFVPIIGMTILNGCWSCKCAYCIHEIGRKDYSYSEYTESKTKTYSGGTTKTGEVYCGGEKVGDVYEESGSWTREQKREISTTSYTSELQCTRCGKKSEERIRKEAKGKWKEK